MRIAVCDDDQAIREELSRLIQKQVSEVDIAGHIREQEESGRQRSIIIFVTGYREYMEAAFDVNAFHYLIKPVDVEKFSEVFSRAWKEASVFCEQEKKYIMVKSAGVQQKLLLKNIYYIERVSIYLVDSILSGIYSQGFLKEKYGKKAVLAAWGAAYFLIQIAVFEILDTRFPISESSFLLPLASWQGKKSLSTLSVYLVSPLLDYGIKLLIFCLQKAYQIH